MSNKLFTSSLLKIMPSLGLLISLAGCSWVSLQSVSDSGQLGNAASDLPELSNDGRFIAFHSTADNLIPGDTNGVQDVFVRDVLLGTINRISIDSLGNEANGTSFEPSISADGRYIVFSSTASNLVANDTNNVSDVFLHDRDTETTSRISVNIDGIQADGPSQEGVVSSDGGYAAFSSLATNLVSNDTNQHQDIFETYLESDWIVLASKNESGTPANGPSRQPTIALWGEGLAFVSDATNLVPDDTNNVADIFNYGIHNGGIARMSVNASGVEANLPSSDPAFEDYGNTLTFLSAASNLVASDTNNAIDVFVREGFPTTLSRASISTAGTQANGDSMSPSLSADARFAVFASSASNLVANDSNGVADIFAHDRTTGTTSRVSADSLDQVEADGASLFASISLDGRYIAISTEATNLVKNDNNSVKDVLIRAFPQPTVTSALPKMLPIGATTSITLTGTYLAATTNLYLAGARIDNLVVVDEHTLTADITVPVDKPAGAKDVRVFVLGTGAGTNTGATGVCKDCVTFL